jgi:hypothetical protein
LKSDKVLRYIKDHGGPKACLKYLEYLTLECGVSDHPIHTELGCLYVQYINSILQNYIVTEKLPGQDQPIHRIDTDKADNDENIFSKFCNQ